MNFSILPIYIDHPSTLLKLQQNYSYALADTIRCLIMPMDVLNPIIHVNELSDTHTYMTHLQHSVNFQDYKHDINDVI